jgi:hypothetical protein
MISRVRRKGWAGKKKETAKVLAVSGGSEE